MDGLEKRMHVLEYSLLLEDFVSLELAKLLEIKNYKTSKSLGNGSSSLSVNQKLNLLLDVENLTKDDKTTIEHFMSIRNQFMHNVDASSYSYVIGKLDGLENKLRKKYPNNFTIDDLEKSFEYCIDFLYTDSIKILLEQKGNKLRNKLRRIFIESTDILMDKRKNSLEKNLKLLEDFVENYPVNCIEKLTMQYEILKMDNAIKQEMINDTLDEMVKMEDLGLNDVLKKKFNS